LAAPFIPTQHRPPPALPQQPINPPIEQPAVPNAVPVPSAPEIPAPSALPLLPVNPPAEQPSEPGAVPVQPTAPEAPPSPANVD
ncbi:MAG TPA: hypothetical protein VIN36_00985, partial [Thiobacillus sp.]